MQDVSTPFESFPYLPVPLFKIIKALLVGLRIKVMMIGHYYMHCIYLSGGQEFLVLTVVSVFFNGLIAKIINSVSSVYVIATMLYLSFCY